MTSVFARAAELDRYLGDPSSPSAVLREAEILASDEEWEFPHAAVEALDAWGLQRAYVPTDLGGDFGDVLSSMLQIRQVARRDLTPAVAHGKTFLGAICPWIVGGPIARQVAPMALSGAPVSWGLTEQGRGSDIMRSATRYSATSDLVLEGGKWPINNATRGRAMCVLVRTREEPGPRSLSLLLVDKEEVDTTRVAYRPKVRTHGIRGADISGVDWRGVPVSRERLVGDTGQGLELVLRALQITRPTCTALSLGGADRGVLSVLGFLKRRRLYGRSLADLRPARIEAGAVLADALVAEATAAVGARHATSLTEEMALVSALVKFVVPATVDALFSDAARLIGARSQLSGIAGAGLFEKAMRDSRVVGIFDGNSVVNLHAIINQFGAVRRQSDETLDLDRLQGALDPGGSPGAIDLARLRLVTRNGSSLLAAVPGLSEMIGDRASSSLAPVVSAFSAAALGVIDEVRDAKPRPSPGVEHFDLARRLAEAFAGAACLAVAARNSAATDLASTEVWLAAALARICERLGRPVDAAATACDDLLDASLALDDRGESVTLLSGWTSPEGVRAR